MEDDHIHKSVMCDVDVPSSSATAWHAIQLEQHPSMSACITNKILLIYLLL